MANKFGIEINKTRTRHSKRDDRTPAQVAQSELDANAINAQRAADATAAATARETQNQADLARQRAKARAKSSIK